MSGNAAAGLTDAHTLAILAVRLVAEVDVAQAASKLGIECFLINLTPLKALERTAVAHRLCMERVSGTSAARKRCSMWGSSRSKGSHSDRSVDPMLWKSIATLGDPYALDRRTDDDSAAVHEKPVNARAELRLLQEAAM